jgi:hypothetical protein
VKERPRTERLALAQAGQDQQGLLAGVQLPPGRPGRPAVAADDPGGEGEGLAVQRQRGNSFVMHRKGNEFALVQALRDVMVNNGHTR